MNCKKFAVLFLLLQCLLVCVSCEMSKGEERTKLIGKWRIENPDGSPSKDYYIFKNDGTLVADNGMHYWAVGDNESVIISDQPVDGSYGCEHGGDFEYRVVVIKGGHFTAQWYIEWPGQTHNADNYAGEVSWTKVAQ